MEKIKSSVQFSHSSLLAFVMGMMGVMMMVTIQLLNIHPTQILRSVLIRPTVERPQTELTPQLEKIKNDFFLKKSTPIVKKAHAANAEYDGARAYAVVDYDTGDVLLSKNLEEELPIASLTKVMTSVVALDVAKQDDLFTIRERAVRAIPTKIGVVDGEKMKLLELLKAALLTSANDATEAIRNEIDEKHGSGTFVSLMNEKASIIGLASSRFSNPQGFDSKNNYSTVGDLAVLTHYALFNYPTIAAIAKEDYAFLPEDANHKQFDLYNWNGLIGVYPGTIGLKIGNTGDASYTTIVVSERSGHKLIAVLLGAPGVSERDLWTAQLLDEGFSTFGLPKVEVTTEALDNKYQSWQYWN